MQSKVVDPEVVLWVFFYVYKVELLKVSINQCNFKAEIEYRDLTFNHFLGVWKVSVRCLGDS